MTVTAFMRPGSSRPLTEGERQVLSPELVAALDAAGVEPQIVARPSWATLAVRLWRGYPPVMVLGRAIYWPGALKDFSLAPPRVMAVLQHELQHVLEFKTGDLTRLGYVFGPRNWTYRYELAPHSRWADFGAEQRASLVEHYWLATHGAEPGLPGVDAFRRLIPWLSQ